MCAEDVGLQERFRLIDRAVHMCLSREVDDSVHAFCCCRDYHAITDVSMDEGLAWIALNISQVVWISRIGELVQADYLRSFVLGQLPANEVRPDEARSPTNEKPHPFFTPQSYPISGSSKGRRNSSG